MKKILAVIIILFTIVINSQARLKFKSLTTRDGLPHSIVRKVFQDHKGFIYIATGNGLAIYNGKTFKNYYPNKNDIKNSLPYHIVSDFILDRDNNVWILTEKGIGIYNIKTEKIKNLSYNDEYGLDFKDIPAATTLFFGADSTLWVNAGTLYRFNLRTKERKKYFSRYTDNFSAYLKFKNEIYFITRSGLFKINNKNNEPEKINLNLSNYNLENNEGFNSLDSIKGHFVISIAKKGLIFFDINTQKIDRFVKTEDLNINKESFQDVNIKVLKDNIWLSTHEGLCIYNMMTNSIVKYSHNPYDPYSIRTNTVTHIYEDKNGLVWLSLFKEGICLADPQYNKFTSFYNIPGNTLSLPNNNTMAFYEDKYNNLWMGAFENKITRYNIKDNRFTLFTYGSPNSKGLANWSGPICKILEDKNGNLIFVSWANAVYILEKKKNPDFSSPNLIFTNMYDDPYWNLKTERWALRDAVIDDENNLWIATLSYWGVIRYNLNTKKTEDFTNEKDDTNSLGSTKFWCIIKARNGEIWAGSDKEGLFRYNPKTKYKKKFGSVKNNENSLPSNHIKCIHEDVDGSLWLGTEGGLCHFDPINEKIIKNYSQENGLSNNIIYGILEDKNDNLWLTSDNGLTCFNKKTEKTKVYNISNGLINSEFNINSYFKNDKGEFYIGGVSGFDKFHPDNMQINPNPAVPIITEFKISNTKVGPGEKYNGKIIYDCNLNYSESLNLSWKENDFSFSLGALHYTDPIKNQIAYKLEGYHEDWIYTNLSKNEAAFSNLPGGDYELLIKAANSDGVWCKEPMKLKIKIIPPFWKTWWFFTILGLLITGSTWKVLRDKDKAAKESRKKLEEEIEKRTSEIKKQNDEILKTKEREKIQKWLTEGFALITGLLTKSESNSLQVLAEQTLNAIAEYLGAKTGVIVLLDQEYDKEGVLKVMARFGPKFQDLEITEYKTGEGIIGACFLDRKKIIIKNAPEEFLNNTSKENNSNTAEIILMPIQTDKFILGVIELCFSNPTEAEVTELLEKLSEVIALNYNNAILNEKTRLYLEQARQQQEEQRAQEEELRQNLEELFATQEEIARREREYQEKIEELQKRISNYNK